MAFTCMKSGPCEKVTVVSEDPAVAEPRIASLAMLQPNGGGPTYGGAPNAWHNQATAAAVVVVGKSVGKTRVQLLSADGNRTIDVTVVAPPVPALVTLGSDRTGDVAPTRSPAPAPAR